MTSRVKIPPASMLLGVAIILLAVGLVVDLGFTQPRVQEVRRLDSERRGLLDRLTARSVRDREAEQLARSIGATDLKGAIEVHRNSDPVTFLATALDDNKLTTIELGTTSSHNTGQLTRTRFSLRVRGRYNRILDFVRTIERSPRLVTVDALSIVEAEDSNLLEGRIDASVYEFSAGISQ